MQADADQLDVERVRVAVGAEQRLEVLKGRQRALRALRALGGVDVHLLADLQKHGEDQLLLGLEVVVDQALRDAGLLRDVLDGGVLVALAAQVVEGRLQDLVSVVAGQLELSSLVNRIPG